MNADSGTVSVIDLEAMKVMRTITVKPAMQYAAVTPDGMLFVNDEDANEMETIDVANGVVGPAVSMPECEASSSLAYDANGQGLIAACVNGKAAIVDAKQHRLTGLVDISLSPDAVMLEERRRLVFVPCGEDGVLDILSLAGSEMMWVGRVQTEKDARTGAIDPANGKLHLPTASFAATPGPNRRPVAPPGAFHVLVVRPENAG